jgi:phosphoglycerate kinase
MRQAIQHVLLICVPELRNSFSMDVSKFKDKAVLMRVDFNVPLDSEKHITDDTRMRKALPSIKAVVDNGGKLILMSHLGRPQKKKLEDGSIDVDKFSLRPLVDHLSELTGTSVLFASDCGGEDSKSKASKLAPGEILLLENTRFYPGEEKGDEAFARSLADLADIYVNDAFGTAHRAHASTTLVAHHFSPDDRMFGYLMEAELTNAGKVLNSAEKPLLAILGGAKVSDKIGLLRQLLNLADTIIVGGAMAFTFVKARGGNTGKSLVEDDKLDLANDIVNEARSKGVQLMLPTDAIIADAFEATANTRTVDIDEIPEGWMGLDIGPDSIDAFAAAISNARTILWNGPMGVFEMEPFARGTLAIAKSVAERTRQGAFSMVGGGDSVAAVNQSGLAKDISFISTGGGAMLEFLEGKELPGVAAIKS